MKSNLHTISHLTSLALAAAFLPHHSIANDHEHHNQQHTHVHGVAEITLAMENKTLEIELSSPAVNIVGFEHKASTGKQIKQARTARDTLLAAEKLFTLTGSECTLTESEVDTTAITGPDHSCHQPHQETHSDISAKYSYHCEQTANISAVTLILFNHFPALKTINTQWVTESGQGSSTLTATNQTVQLKQTGGW